MHTLDKETAWALVNAGLLSIDIYIMHFGHPDAPNK